MPPSLTTEAEIDALRLKAFKSNDPTDVNAYHKATSKWFQDRHYRAMAESEQRSSLLSLIEDMAKALDEVSSMSDRQIGVPTDTEAANEHAMIAQSMSETARSALSRYTEFMEQNNG